MEENAKSIARPAASRSLSEAIRKARLEEAEHLDRAADLRDSEIARLELLKADLETVFAELPPHDDRFNLALVPSRPARLWIDLFTYAAIDEASGAYLFVRNSEEGRRTLYSSTNVADMADRITRYVAREIVRRERLEAALAEAPRIEPLTAPRPSGINLSVVIAAFAIGLLAGAAGLFATVWLTAP
jgi:demethoxyubiquinone hydroxylase (CLK1/Coq7/Cat5 family)